MNIQHTLFKFVRISFLTFFLYLYIYNPPFAFLPLTISKLSYAFFLPYLVLNKQLQQQFLRLFTFEFFILSIIILYSLGIEFMNGMSGSVFWGANLFMLFENFFFAFIIANYLNKNYAQNADILLFAVTVIAASITFFLILNPTLNFYIKQSVLKLDDVAVKLEFRCFGIADSFTFAYAIVQGIAVALCLEKIRNILVCSILFILLCISVMFNARIGFVPIIFILFYMIFMERKGRKVLQIFFFFSILILFFLGTDLVGDYEQTIDWAISFFQEISDVILSDDVGMESTNMDTLLNDMVVLPDTFMGWIWGTGENIFSSPIRNSDIGYFIQLNYGGLTYCFFFALLVFSLFLKIQRYRIEEKWFPYLFIVVILACSYKGLFLITNSGFRILMILYFLYFLRARTVRQLQ